MTDIMLETAVTKELEEFLWQALMDESMGSLADCPSWIQKSIDASDLEINISNFGNDLQIHGNELAWPNVGVTR